MQFGLVKRDVPYRLIIRASKAWMRFAVPIDMTDTERVPRTGGAVIACNHNSYFDWMMAAYPAAEQKRFTRFMAKREIFDNRFGGPFMRAFKHLSVDRASGAEALDVAVDACRHGEVVGIYPEATISRSFLIKDLKSGAVRIAAAAGVPLVPVVHFGMHRYQTKDHPRDFSRGKAVVIRVGEPMYPTGEDPVAETAELRRRMEALLDECVNAYSQKEDGAWWLPASYGGSAPSLEKAAELDEEEKRIRAERKAARKQS